jgi:hypothetical protein
MFRIIQLTKDHYSSSTQASRQKVNKGEMVTFVYITINDRKFGQDLSAKASPKTRKCPTNKCNMKFRLEDDGENLYGKAVFEKDAKHSE